MFNTLKVVTVFNDEGKFEEDVNGWCCNAGYKIISCQVQPVSENETFSIMYTAFLGK
jgi:hypothetical protein